MKEIWFRTHYSDKLYSNQLKRTFRELPEQTKNNNYAIEEIVKCKIHDGQKNFQKQEFLILITGIQIRGINTLTEQEFQNADVDSKEDLKTKMSVYYKKQYSDSDIVRVIEFEYL